MIAYRLLPKYEMSDRIDHPGEFEPEIVSGLVVQRAGQEDDVFQARKPYPFDTIIIGDHADDSEFTMISIHGSGFPDVIDRCTIRQSRKPAESGRRPQLIIARSEGKDDNMALVHADGFSVQGIHDYVQPCSDRGRALRRTTYEDGIFPCTFCGTMIDQRTFVHPDEGDHHCFHEVRVGDFVAGVYNWAEGTSCLGHEYLISMKVGSKCRITRREKAFLLTWDGKQLETRPFEAADARVVQVPALSY